jgi:hypothetical protein
MTEKTYLMIYEGRKFLVETDTLVEAMEAANRHFKPHSGMWIAKETPDYTYEWKKIYSPFI